jgi:hypothetical protein
MAEPNKPEPNKLLKLFNPFKVSKLWKNEDIAVLESSESRGEGTTTGTTNGPKRSNTSQSGQIQGHISKEGRRYLGLM